MFFCIFVREGFFFVVCEGVILKYFLEGYFIYKYFVEGRIIYVIVINFNICGFKSNKSNIFCFIMVNLLR